MSRRVIVLTAALLAVSLVHPDARQPGFRTGVELVTLDLQALGPDGRPLTDLAATDVILRVNGRPREIRSLQYVRLAEPAASAGAIATTRELPPPFGSNYAGDAGRTIVLVIENESLRPGIARHATDAAAEFVDHLSPRDRVALVTMPRGGLQMDLTRDHARVIELIRGVSGQGPTRTTESEQGCRTRLTLEGLTDLLGGLTGVDVPKTVVVLSAGLLLPRRDALATQAPGPCEIRPSHYDDVGSAAIAARANFFVIRPDDFVVESATNAFADPSASRFRSADMEIAGLESLAGVTSGQFLRITPADHSAFERVLRESASYYLLAFEPLPSERNNLSHRVDVTPTRRDAHLRARPRLLIPKPALRPAPDKQRPAPPPASAITAQGMIRDGRAYRDLPLRTAAFASSSGDDRQLKLVAIAEPLDPGVTLTSVAFGLIDARGRLVAQWTANERELALTPVMSAGLAEPGAYRLRMAAVDVTGRRGAADHDVTFQLTPAGPLKLSMLALGVSRPGFRPQLEFGHEPTAMGYFEIFGSPPDGALSAALELAPGTDQPALIRVPAALVASADPMRRTVTGVVPIADQPPGDYVVRGLVFVDGKPLGTVSSTLRKSVR
jgi:VWFA-related protein